MGILSGHQQVVGIDPAFSSFAHLKEEEQKLRSFTEPTTEVEEKWAPLGCFTAGQGTDRQVVDGQQREDG